MGSLSKGSFSDQIKSNIAFVAYYLGDRNNGSPRLASVWRVVGVRTSLRSNGMVDGVGV